MWVCVLAEFEIWGRCSSLASCGTGECEWLVMPGKHAMSVWRVRTRGVSSARVSVQKSIMSFTQIKLHHSTPLLAFLTPSHSTIRKSNVRKMFHFATKHLSLLMIWSDNAMAMIVIGWVLWVLRNVRLVLCCDVIQWSCEPLEAYGDIMRGEWPSPNMPWSGSKFSSKSCSNKIAKFERKTDCCRASSKIGWEHLISVLKSYNNWEDSEKFAKNAMQILCIKLEQLWWYIVELSCIHPASGSMESISMFEIWQAIAGQGCTK